MMGFLLSGGAGSTPSATQSLSDGMSTLTTMVGDCMNMLTSNPILIIFLCGSVIGVAFGIIRKMKGAAKS